MQVPNTEESGVKQNEGTTVSTNTAPPKDEDKHQVVEMTEEQADAWKAIADKTSYKAFSEKVKGGKELIAKALAVK